MDFEGKAKAGVDPF